MLFFIQWSLEFEGLNEGLLRRGIPTCFFKDLHGLFFTHNLLIQGPISTIPLILYLLRTLLLRSFSPIRLQYALCLLLDFLNDYPIALLLASEPGSILLQLVPAVPHLVLEHDYQRISLNYADGSALTIEHREPAVLGVLQVPVDFMHRSYEVETGHRRVHQVQGYHFLTIFRRRLVKQGDIFGTDC